MKHVCQYCGHCIFVEEWEEGYGFTDYNHCEIATERNKRIDEIPKKNCTSCENAPITFWLRGAMKNLLQALKKDAWIEV